MRAWVYGDLDLFFLSIPNLVAGRGIYTGSDRPKQSEMDTLLRPHAGLWVVLTGGPAQVQGPACSIGAP